MILQGKFTEKGRKMNIKYFITCICAIFLFSGETFAKGDLAIRAKKLELKLGSDKSDYEMSQKVFELETGKAYRLEISSMGFKEYEFEAEDFFRNVWIRNIEVEG